MNFLIKGRCQGKTTKLIITSEITQYPILVLNNRRKDNIVFMAKELGCNIPEPISYESIRRYPDGRFMEKVLIDDAEDIIKKALEDHLRAEVVAVSITDKNFN